jgi:hypothetical protein
MGKALIMLKQDEQSAAQKELAAAAAAYFKDYSAAFAAYDLEALLRLFDAPLTVAAPHCSVIYGDAEAIKGYLSGLLDQYRAIGLAWPVPAAHWAWPCGDRLARAETLWLLRNKEKDEIMRFSTSYILRRDASSAWRAAVVVAYEEDAAIKGHAG